MFIVNIYFLRNVPFEGHSTNISIHVVALIPLLAPDSVYTIFTPSDITSSRLGEKHQILSSLQKKNAVFLCTFLVYIKLKSHANNSNPSPNILPVYHPAHKM